MILLNLDILFYLRYLIILFLAKIPIGLSLLSHLNFLNFLTVFYLFMMLYECYSYSSTFYLLSFIHLLRNAQYLTKWHTFLEWFHWYVRLSRCSLPIGQCFIKYTFSRMYKDYICGYPRFEYQCSQILVSDSGLLLSVFW